MSKTVLKAKYAPLYITLLATGIVMVFLFLRPGSALGLQVEVDPPENDRNGQTGFVPGDTIEISFRILLEGDVTPIIDARLTIVQLSGQPGFTDIDVVLPILPGTADLTIPQGTLFVSPNPPKDVLGDSP